MVPQPLQRRLGASVGVSIGTLDDPGWRIQVDLRETKAEGRTSEWVKMNRSVDDWLMDRAVGDKLNPRAARRTFRGSSSLYELV